MLLEQRATLAFGHATPHPELHPVVQRVRAALSNHRAVATDHGRLALCRPPDKQLVGIGGPTPRL
jgi:hypothetical protein